MEVISIIEEAIDIAKDDGQHLAAILAYPESGQPQRGALLCSPHPHYAGDMDNNVIRAIAADLATDSVTMRFDYRGVGTSSIALPAGLSVFDYWEALEEDKNYSDPLADTRVALKELLLLTRGLPLAIIGYSFGAVVAISTGIDNSNICCLAAISPPLSRVELPLDKQSTTPCLLVTGNNDFVCPSGLLHECAASGGAFISAEILNGVDHFFRGDEHRLSAHVRTFISDATT